MDKVNPSIPNSGCFYKCGNYDCLDPLATSDVCVNGIKKTMGECN